MGVLVMHTPAADPEALSRYADAVIRLVEPELERASRVGWHFQRTVPSRLDTDDPRRASRFLDEALLRMVEGPFDLVLVVTDVGLVSRKRAVVAGLGSEVARVAILSTRKLVVGGRKEPPRSIETPHVIANGATLTLHLLGHVLGLHHTSDPQDAMSPFTYDVQRTNLLPYGARSAQRLERAARHAQEPEIKGAGVLRSILFHLWSGLTHPRKTLVPVLTMRAPLLALNLSGLSTAAFATALVLVFTQEIWDSGLNLQNRTAILFAVAAVLAATVYLTVVKDLFLPRKERRVLTRHAAIVNDAVFLTMLSAMIGLFLLLMAALLVIAFGVMRSQIVTAYPIVPLEHFDPYPRLRVATFIASLASLTGALAGGLDSDQVMRQFVFFRDEP